MLSDCVCEIVILTDVSSRSKLGSLEVSVTFSKCESSDLPLRQTSKASRRGKERKAEIWKEGESRWGKKINENWRRSTSWAVEHFFLPPVVLASGIVLLGSRQTVRKGNIFTLIIQLISWAQYNWMGSSCWALSPDYMWTSKTCKLHVPSGFCVFMYPLKSSSTASGHM